MSAKWFWVFKDLLPTLSSPYCSSPELNTVMPIGMGEVFEGTEADKNAVNNCFAGLMSI